MEKYDKLGEDIHPDAYVLDETRAFHRALNKTESAVYIRSFKWEDKRVPKHIEGVEFDIETSAFSNSPIENIERTCVVFAPNQMPIVFALRKDFPRQILHVNLFPKDLPVSPCLYRENYSELKLRLTWEFFIERIHEWYKRISDGTSHLESQALEPMILDGAPLFVSKSFFNKDKIYVASKTDGLITCTSIDLKKELPKDATVLIPINGEPTVSRSIEYEPRTFRELIEITKKVGIDLRKELSDFTWQIENLVLSNIKAGQASDPGRRKFLATEYKEFMRKTENYVNYTPAQRAQLKKTFKEHTSTANENRQEAKEAILSWVPLIWLRLPKKRTEKSEVEWFEDIAFVVFSTIGQLCDDLNIYSKQNDFMIHERSLVGVSPNAVNVSGDISNIYTVKPIVSMDMQMAQKLAGLEREVKNNLAIGAGALGSQVITNLTRMGIGKWHILDNDIILPHNLCRHALFSEQARFPKAYALATELNCLVDDPEFSKGILSDFLEYKGDLTGYDMIYDFSVNNAVRKNLALCEERPPVKSSFMTQNGRFLIILSEGTEKATRIDDLEYQVACACVNEEYLKRVLEIQDEQEIRYSGACSDITTVLPQDRVATHSGIASSYIKGHAEQTEAMISVWELTDDSTVRRHTILTYKVKSAFIKGWNFRITQKATQKMKYWRAKKLNVETGGVLIGGFDTYNQIVYIVDVIPSPKDSVEEPYSYIRGFDGLKGQMEYINTVSGRRLNYVGEWHSHIGGITPSGIDKIALKEQSSEMSKAGLPGIMIIIGNYGKYKILLEQE